MKGSLEEKSLLYKVQTQKDPEAFALLYDQYVEPIYRFVYFKISHREEAEDVTGEVFLKCWQYLSIGKGKEIRSFSALLYTIARNQVIEVYRNRAKRPEAPLTEEDDQGDKGKAARSVEIKEETEKLLMIIRKLKQEYQEVLLLRYVEDFSIGEIAVITRKTRTSVRVTLHRELKKLKNFAEDIHTYA
jgi:RNA polymerase sigma-70 factor (ECF subfamily)